MRYLFAVNPASGKGKALLKMEKLKRYLDQDGFDYMTFQTKPTHYASKLRTLILTESITHVFAVGGDGTASEVLNAIIGLDVLFGIIPFGTGNDFARLLKIPNKTKEVFNMIKKNHSDYIDVGKANDQYFLNYISFGLDAEISHNSEKYKRFMPGGSAYVVGLFKTLFKYKPTRLSINNHEEELILTTIHNGTYYGGGMKISPYAKLDDGLFELCVIKGVSKFKLLFIFPTIFSGKHVHFKQYVSFKQNDHYTIVPQEEVMMGIDGETVKINESITVETIKKTVKLIQP
ncbi:diacylglycerol/lipid kinase family protein [Haloplasma contractile]|uniref:Diacylglycerol kinase protein n=1 Tax=Haloplasma contractile SSD-17B TaxID=1033810 RepID=U2FF45_9MOLU|nr:diacylglycerol kinase family protein [Haloplasma contractile]ERJ11530.1 diacylglycerol kinase protein [Haloplasma contractile SSD-17B]